MIKRRKNQNRIAIAKQMPKQAEIQQKCKRSIAHTYSHSKMLNIQNSIRLAPNKFICRIDIST